MLRPATGRYLAPWPAPVMTGQIRGAAVARSMAGDAWQARIGWCNGRARWPGGGTGKPARPAPQGGRASSYLRRRAHHVRRDSCKALPAQSERIASAPLLHCVPRHRRCRDWHRPAPVRMADSAVRCLVARMVRRSADGNAVPDAAVMAEGGWREPHPPKRFTFIIADSVARATRRAIQNPRGPRACHRR